MKKLIFAIIATLAFIECGFGDPYGLGKSKNSLEDFFFGLGYSIAQGTMSLSGNATFYGYGSNITLKSEGGKTTWSLFSSSVTDGTSQRGTLNASDSFSVDFKKEASSPTILTFELQSGTTLQWFIGGLKKQ